MNVYISLLFLDRKEELEFWGEFFLAIQTVRKVNSTDSAICMNGHSKSLYIVGAVSPAGEIWQVKLNLIPTLIKPHGHCTDKGLDSSCRLIIGCSESAANIFIIQDLDLEGEVFFKLSGWTCTFLMIMTRKGNFIPRVYLGFTGQVIKAVVTLVPMI